jgi:uncharacterized membrane protein YdjX (TVP38/TMEM64 family)
VVVNRRLAVRLGVLAAVVLLVAGAWRFGLLERLEALHPGRALSGFRLAVRQHVVRSLFLLGGLYVLVTILSLPVAVYLSVLSGFLFGRWLGTGIVVCAASLGAFVLFAFARWLLGRWLRGRLEHQPQAAVLLQGFEGHAFHYLLLLRLIPLFPFWLVNLVPAVTTIRTRDYVVATFLGIIPGSFVFVNFGAHLRRFRLGDPWTAGNLTALGLVVLITLLPLAYRTWKGQPASGRGPTAG